MSLGYLIIFKLFIRYKLPFFYILTDNECGYFFGIIPAIESRVMFIDVGQLSDDRYLNHQLVALCISFLDITGLIHSCSAFINQVLIILLICSLSLNRGTRPCSER